MKIKSLFVAAVAMLVPFTASAQSCGPATPVDVPLFEAAKTAFLKTDYSAFADLVDDYIPRMDDQFDALFGPLEVFKVQGFARCRTILQRREEPSFVQDIVLYFPEGSAAPMALHLVGAEVDGEMRVLEFSYNTAISKLLEGLH